MNVNKFYVFVFVCSLICDLNADSILKSVWQEYHSRASVVSTETNVWEIHNGSGTVPGGRQLTSSVSVPPSPHQAGAASFAEVRQKTDITNSGFITRGNASVSQSGDFESGAFPSGSVAIGTLNIEFEVIGVELGMINIKQLAIHSQEFLSSAYLGVWLMRKYDGVWYSDAPLHLEMKGDPYLMSLVSGEYKIILGSEVASTFTGSTSGNANYEFEIEFSNYSIAQGAFQAHPILPEDNMTFSGVSSNRWFDPPLARGYSFIAEEGTKFEKIVSLPVGFESVFHIYVNGSKISEARGGESIDFREITGDAVSSFDVKNITPFVDSESPIAFPIMLRFTSETGSFQMIPIEAPYIHVTQLSDGGVKIEFDGIVQTNESLSESNWEDMIPQPERPFIIPKNELKERGFYRARSK